MWSIFITNKRQPDGSFEILERIEGGAHQVSICRGLPHCLVGPPAIFPNRATILRLAWPICARSCLRCSGPRPPLPHPKLCVIEAQVRPNSSAKRASPRISPGQIAQEIVAWIAKGEGETMIKNILLFAHLDESGNGLPKAAWEALGAAIDLAKN